ncbi:hypothetical protein DMENIID0001_051690 [Sergentomyia squamirostris]
MSLLTFAEALDGLLICAGESQLALFLEECDTLFNIYGNLENSREFALCVKRKIRDSNVLGRLRGKNLESYETLKAILREVDSGDHVPLLMQGLMTAGPKSGETISEFGERVQKLLDALNSASSRIAEGASSANIDCLNSKSPKYESKFKKYLNRELSNLRYRLLIVRPSS